MSQLKVGNIVHIDEESPVEISWIELFAESWGIDYSVNTYHNNGTFLYDSDEESFYFKQNDQWVTLSGGCCGIDEVLAIGNVTDKTLTLESLIATGSITGDTITAGSITSDTITSTVTGYTFPDGTVQTTAWMPGDCDECDIGDLGDVNTDPGTLPGGFPSGFVVLTFDHITNIWYPDNITTSDLADICPCDEYEIGDILTWTGTCWESIPIPGLTPCTFNLEADGGDTLLLECGDTIKIVGDASINTITSIGPNGEDQVEISFVGAGGGADNLGNHIATENIQTSDFWLSNDGTDKGIYIKSDGNVGINTGVGIEPETSLVVDGGTSIDDSSNPSGYINIGDASAEHMSIDLMGIQTKTDSDTLNDLHLQPLGGHVGVGVALANETKQTIDIENKGGFHVNQFESQGDPPPLNGTAWVAAVNAGDFRSYKVFLTVVDKTLDNLGNPVNEYMSTTIVVIHDGTNVYHSEYGRIEINPNGADPLNDPLSNGFTFQSTMNQPGVLDEVTLTIEIGPNGNIFEGTAIITALQGDL